LTLAAGPAGARAASIASAAAAPSATAASTATMTGCVARMQMTGDRRVWIMMLIRISLRVGFS
jgi:hypothetical protein